MTARTIAAWLKENNKGDLQGCTWEELDDLYAYLHPRMRKISDGNDKQGGD